MRRGYRYNRKSVEVTASDDSPAISLADMKEFLRQDGTADDNIITAYIATATEAVKEYTRRAILTETFVFRADGFVEPDSDWRIMSYGTGTHDASVPWVLGGGETFDIPFPVIQSIASVVTYDRSNAPSTFDSSRYNLDAQTGRIYLNESETWPVDLRAQNAVEVTYVAGYGSSNIPDPILEAIRGYVTQMYDGCSGATDDFRALLAPYRRMDELPWGL